jgi:hypothetical protein
MSKAVALTITSPSSRQGFGTVFASIVSGIFKTLPSKSSKSDPLLIALENKAKIISLYADGVMISSWRKDIDQACFDVFNARPTSKAGALAGLEYVRLGIETLTYVGDFEDKNGYYADYNGLMQNCIHFLKKS